MCGSLLLEHALTCTYMIAPHSLHPCFNVISLAYRWKRATTCQVLLVIMHTFFFLAKWYLNYTTKKSHHSLHFIATNLICLSSFGQMPLVSLCVLNILNVLKRPYANRVNAVCMHTFVLIFK